MITDGDDGHDEDTERRNSSFCDSLAGTLTVSTTYAQVARAKYVQHIGRVSCGTCRVSHGKKEKPM